MSQAKPFLAPIFTFYTQQETYRFIRETFLRERYLQDECIYEMKDIYRMNATIPFIHSESI
jgi:hypothetical protein